MEVKKQVTIFLQNESGRLEEVTRILGDNNINISAISIAEASEFGVVRMILDNHEKALKVLKDSKFSVNLVDVLCFETVDTPGALNDALKKLAQENINISYMYGYSNHGSAPMIMKVSDVDKALKALSEIKEYNIYIW